MSRHHASFTAPYTASGHAALVPPPPWHYAGWLLNVAFHHDTDHSEALLPAQVGRLTGHGCVHFAEWQATTDGHELLDPVYSQYRETIVIVEIARPDGTLFNYCPFIWVDQDIALMRGLLQGWPKKHGTTWLTRTLPLAHPAAAPLQAGTRLGASLSVKERRLIDAQATLTGQPGKPHGFLANRTIGAVGWPDLTHPEALPEPAFVLPDIRDKVSGVWHEASATLNVYPHPGEELDLLGELRASEASAGWIGITVAGARPLE